MAHPMADYFVYVDAPQFLKCSICSAVMRNPVSLACGHSFCASCCHLTIASKKLCSVCHQDVVAPPHPNIALCQALDEQLVYCRFGSRYSEAVSPTRPVFARDTEGCPKVLRRFETPSHEKECPWRWVACGLADALTGETCNMLCHKLELAEHQQECDFRLVPCSHEGCDEHVSLRSLHRHMASCLFETIQCENEGCPEFLLRKAMNAHAARCPYRVAACPFHKYGCAEKGNIHHMEEHVRTSINEHLLLACANVEQLHQQRLLERRVTCPKKKFKCIVHNFDAISKKQVIDIDLDVSWKLKIWPNGEDKRHAGYVSIRLFSREATPTYKVEGPYTLRIVNQVDPSKSILKMTEALSRFWADSVRGWGFPAFVKVDDVLNPESGYLRDNTLLVEVEVTVNNVLEVVEYTEADASPLAV